MRRIALVLLVVMFALPAYAINGKKGGGGGGSAFPVGHPENHSDGICTNKDLAFLMTSRWPGNLDTTHLKPVIISPRGTNLSRPGADFFCGPLATEAGERCDTDSDCTGDGCDVPNNDGWITPVASISGWAAITEKYGCGVHAMWNVADGPIQNLDWGSSVSDFALADNGASSPGIEVDCNDATNSRTAGVFSAWPPGGSVRWHADNCWQSANGYNLGAATGGLADPDCDVVVVSDSASTTEIANSGTPLALDPNELRGGRAVITAIGGTGNALGQSREIASNTATTITVGTAFAGDTSGYQFTVVPVGGEPPGGSNPGNANGNTFDIINGGATPGADGTFYIIGGDLFNSWDQDAISQANKPGARLVTWDVGIIGDLLTNAAAAGRLLHNNTSASHGDILIQTRALNAARSYAHDTSDSEFVVGSMFSSLPSNGTSALAKFSGHGTFLFGNTFIGAEGTLGTNNRDAVLLQCNTSSNPDGCRIAAFRNVIMNQYSSAGGQAAFHINVQGGTITGSQEVDIGHNSFVNVDTDLRLTKTSTDTFDTNIRIYGNDLTGASRFILSTSHTGTLSHGTITAYDNVTNDADLTSEWRFNGTNYNTAALMAAAMDTAGIDCGDDTCANNFFANGDSISGICAGTGPAGTSDEDVSECFQAASTGIVKITLHDENVIPPTLLESGEECDQVWMDFSDGGLVSPDRGAY